MSAVAAGIIWAAVMYENRTGNNVPGLPESANNVVNDANDAIMDYAERFKKGLIDRWNQTGVGEMPTALWPNYGEGLELEVWNALSEDWYPFFQQAMHDWAFGHNPTSLTLYLKNVTEDPSCEPASGVLKVCNSNYGETGWKGINECAINGFNKIVQSVAKMNEYYLSEASDGERQYTMCHECGHGWGLGHQDENFYNLDLGTCLDYTLRPSENQRPNEKDYDILATVYGTVNNGTSSSSGRKNERDLHLRANSKLQKPKFISFTDAAHRHKWRLLEKRRGMELHELDLGDGNRMQARLMMADFF